jgi:hypothetical protein
MRQLDRGQTAQNLVGHGRVWTVIKGFKL